MRVPRIAWPLVRRWPNPYIGPAEVRALGRLRENHPDEYDAYLAEEKSWLARRK